jgi:glycosyltransferase involved in cell wall biosynthesis
MRILQVTPRVAWPATDGGRVVMLQLARALHDLGAHVEILSLNPRKQRVGIDAARKALAPLSLDAIDVDTSAHFAALLRSFRLGAPQVVARFFSPRFAAALQARLRDRDFEVVQIESPFLLPYVDVVRECSRAAVVLRSLNVEFRIWERLAMRETNRARRAAFRTIARSLRRYEIEHLDTCDAIIPIADADAIDIRALGCTRPIYVLPAGVDLNPSPTGRRWREAPDEGPASLHAPHPAPSRPLGATLSRWERGKVGFIASLDYRPNQEAAMWIAEQLRPRMPPETELHVAGSRAPEWLRERISRSGVTYEGEVEDATAFVDRMRVMIVPIFSGGGMRVKILEAMSRGKAVVSTSIGAEGIDVTPGENIVIADDAAAFSSAIESLLRDPARAHAIGEAARKLTATRYSTETLVRGLLAFYDELTKRSNVSSGD